MKLEKYTIVFLLLLSFVFLSCQKFLEEKPDKTLVIPKKLSELQALLDNSNVFNTGTAHLLGEISGDNYYLLKPVWQALSTGYEKNAYIWSEEIFEGAQSTDWNNPSLAVFYCNVVLEGVNKIIPAQQELETWNIVKGGALFYRSYVLYQLAQLFCKTYVPTSAATDLGIPLRLESDISIKTTRSTIEQTYRQLIKDAQEATQLLPQTSVLKTRPIKATAHALLARIYLQMQDYTAALNYANLSLDAYNSLIDYNTISSQAGYPFTRFNTEVLLHSHTLTPTILQPNRLIILPELYNSYDSNDLRKSCFFYIDNNGHARFKGSYFGSDAFFTGITTAEVMLIKAECEVRLGLQPAAVNSINNLLKYRYKKNTFPGIIYNDNDDLLRLILQERRKELIFRGIRWSDLKRLNLVEKTAITIKRIWDNEVYTLEPNSSRYIFPIPDAVISITGIEQNKR